MFSDRFLSISLLRGRDVAMPTEIDYDHRGLAKLMLKMPALRGKLQIMGARNAEFLNLCGAFEQASSTLERLKKESKRENRSSIEEYENVCREIEEEVLRMCAR
jgi:hypothetical protein